MFRDEKPNQNVREETISKAIELAYVGVNGKRSQTQQKIRVRWCSLPLNWCKVNSDGFALGNPRRSGDGGLIHNNKG